MTYYHGTSKHFNQFDNNELGSTTGAIATTLLGFCFSTRKEDAEMYAVGNEGRVLECDFDNKYFTTMTSEFFLQCEFNEIDTDELLSIREDLIEQGYDGIEVIDTGIYIIFEASNINILN